MRRRKAACGTSLIEAMLAVALLASVMLSVAGSQLAMARAQRATIWRERAQWLADARIERLRAAPRAEDDLASLAAVSLPGGKMAFDAGPGGVRFAVVGWREGDAAASTRCEVASGPAKPPSCVRVPFREGGADAR
ncbi:type IV pilus modification PilV family protein [Burkholderia stagnalis]